MIDKYVELAMGWMPDLELPRYPGRNWPEEAVCAAVRDTLVDSRVREGLKTMLELTQKNRVEYSAFIIEDEPGEYYLGEIRTDNDPLQVRPGPKPTGAIGQVHTHTRSLQSASDQDVDYIQEEKDKCTFYLILIWPDWVYVVNDAGETMYSCSFQLH